MGFINCPLCEEFTIYSICSECRKLRHYMSIYSRERILEILENVLIRSQDKQDIKIKDELEKEENNIKNKKDDYLKVVKQIINNNQNNNNKNVYEKMDID